MSLWNEYLLHITTTHRTNNSTSTDEKTDEKEEKRREEKKRKEKKRKDRKKTNNKQTLQPLLPIPKSPYLPHKLQILQRQNIFKLAFQKPVREIHT
jgi:hypothetical protein